MTLLLVLTHLQNFYYISRLEAFKTIKKASYIKGMSDKRAINYSEVDRMKGHCEVMLLKMMDKTTQDKCNPLIPTYV